MKQLINFIIVLIALIALLYLSASFVAMNLNPYDWHIALRIAVVAIFITAGVIELKDMQK